LRELNNVTTPPQKKPVSSGVMKRALMFVYEEGIKGIPLKASLIASKTFLAFLPAVEI